MPASVHVRSPHLHCSTARLSCPSRGKVKRRFRQPGYRPDNRTDRRRGDAARGSIPHDAWRFAHDTYRQGAAEHSRSNGCKRAKSR
jgi:hypothetical protein